MKAEIRSIGAYLPERRMANEEFTKFIDTSDEWIVSHTGIKYRHIATKEQAASDLALIAAKKAIKRANIKPEEIDLIIVATVSPDYHGFPSTACILQDKLGAVNAGALDVTAACTGFIYGLEIAKNFIIGDAYKNILVVATEVLSKIMNWKDRNTSVLFGDGAGAAIVTESTGTSRIGKALLRSDGSGAEFLKVPAGGSRNPYNNDTKEEDIYLYMDGQPVYKFAVRVITEILQELLEKNNLSIDDIAYVVPHQANIRIIKAAAKRLAIPFDKFFINMDEVANTSAASIPLALNEMYEKNLLKKGDLILMAAFGGGLTYGGNLCYW